MRFSSSHGLSMESFDKSHVFWDLFASLISVVRVDFVNDLRDFSLFCRGIIGLTPDKLSIILLMSPNALDTSLSFNDPLSIFR